MVLERRMVIEPLRTILGNFWKASHGTIALVIVIVIGSSIASVSAPYIFSRLLDHLNADVWTETILTGFVLYAALMGVALALQHMVQFLSFMSAENLGFIAGTSFFERLVRKSAGFFIEHNPAEIQTAQMRGAQALTIVVQLGLLVFVPGLVKLLLTLGVLGAAIDPEVAMIVLAYGVVFIALSYFANKWTGPHLDQAASSGQENAKFVGNAINAMETLRFFGSTKWMNERFSVSAREVFESWRSFCLKRMGYAGVFGIALAAQFWITFALLLPRYREGGLTVGDIVLFNTLLLQLNHPFEMIGHALDDLARSYTRFMPFARMWGAPEEAETVGKAGFTLGNGRLEFRNVSFSYDGARGIENINFVAERGRLSFITGETGSGKSTIFKLALKSLEPTRGDIRVDGVVLGSINRADWYAAIGVVPQDVVLLNDTLKTNIVLGRTLDEKRLRSAAAKAAILERIEDMPQGFNTVIGERGMKLSGGERQRIAIARALYADPQILFLDEASSALDLATEHEIMDRIRHIAGEVTVLAITHRKAAIRAEDNVIELIAGQQQSVSSPPDYQFARVKRQER